MSRFDVVVIGSGLGGLTAGALLAKAGYSVCLLERNSSLGGAASCYRIGTLTIEASLHETADPRDPLEVKHAILKRLGLLDKITWVPAGNLYTAQGGPLGEPFTLPHGFEAAREVLQARFPAAKHGLGRVLDGMERLHATAGQLGNARDTWPGGAILSALSADSPIVSGWHSSLADVLNAELGSCEAAKCALAANLPYYAADPKRLWWLFFGAAQGGMIGAGGVYVQGGSRQLSIKLAGSIKRSGGTVLLATAATSIELNNAGAVAAVKLSSRGGKTPEKIEAGLVLVNCAPSALVSMLPAEAASRFAAGFSGAAPSTSLFAAHFGLKTNPAQFGLKDYSVIHLPSWMTALEDYSRSAALLSAGPSGKLPPLTVANYGAIDAGLDDGGPLLVTVFGLDDIGNWQGLGKEEEGARRTAWLDAILGELERLYPGFAGAVTEKILMNAASMARYLGTPGGAVYGFDPLPPMRPIWDGLPRTPKTPIEGLYLASAFAGGGGFSGAMASGSGAARLAEAALQRKTA